MKNRGWFSRESGGSYERTRAPEPSTPVIPVSALGPAPVRHGWDNGEKFPGGFGPTELLTADYWTLRARSAQLFETNLYARGMIRRLVTNEINTGLHLEATPAEKILGFGEDELAEWAEDVETRFSLWGSLPRLCDHLERESFGELQCTARMEALICGDLLVVLLQGPATSLPRVRLISGDQVQTPLAPPGVQAGHRIVHGVELDAVGRQVAYWVRRSDSSGMPLQSERIAAVGTATGRPQAWLIYGADKRHDAVRGKPLLSLVLQSLREIDRYRDAVQRKAAINAVIAMFVKKTQATPGSRPLAGGAVRRGTDTTVDQTGKVRTFNVAELIPGVVLDELAVGEEPEGFMPNGTDEKFGDFEEAIIQAVAWGNEVPPEILRLSFSSNYSASQAAINEFKIYLNRVRNTFGLGFCQPIYADWLLSQALRGTVPADALLAAWRDPSKLELFAAWTSSDWTGHIKPAVDLSKLVRGYAELLEQGLMTRDRASRELTGTKYSQNVQKLRRENEQLAEANKPLAALEPAPGRKPDAPDEADDEGEGDDKDDTKKSRAPMRSVS